MSRYFHCDNATIPVRMLNGKSVSFNPVTQFAGMWTGILEVSDSEISESISRVATPERGVREISKAHYIAIKEKKSTKGFESEMEIKTPRKESSVELNHENPLTVVAHVNNYCGYGEVLMEFFSGLTRRGVHCSIRPTETVELFGQKIPYEISSRIINSPTSHPWELLIINPQRPVTAGKRSVFYTMWETDKLHRDWIPNLNRSELVIVPCSFNRDGFRASGVTVPIEVVPLGFQPDIFSPTEIRKDKFVFGAAGRISHGEVRKGVNRAVDVFQRKFPKEITDVEMHVKIHPDDKIPNFNDPRIKVMAEHFPWYKTREWFGNITCFLSLATGEGFGLWQIQAMACGRPLIAAKYSGMADYHSADCGYVIPHSVTPAPTLKNGKWEGPMNGEAGNWAAFNDDAIIGTMMTAYRDWKEPIFKNKSSIAASRAMQFTWEKASSKLHHSLKKIGAIK